MDICSLLIYHCNDDMSRLKWSDVSCLISVKLGSTYLRLKRMTNTDKFEEEKDLIRMHLSKYTRKAFDLLPRLDSPYILDIGCGSGASTMELAELSNGCIVALDIDEHALNRLDAKIKKAGLSHRVSTLRCSMADMNFPDESFDIIWSEGSIYVVGFENGLRAWSRFLRINRFLAVHDETGNLDEKLEQISSCGYDLIDYFILDLDVWWTEYCIPLQKLIDEMRPRCAGELKALALLNENQNDIDMFSVHPELYHSTFFIMRKR
jgi:SAM-dependent methyltransferase